MQFHVNDMTCDGCARGVTRAIQRVDPLAEVDADPPSRRVDVRTTASREAIEIALREAGFPPSAETD